MIANNDLVVIAKTWIQAPKDSTPIEFEEVWDLDGSTHRGAAKQRLEVVFGDLCKYGLASNLDMVEISTMVEIGNGAKRKSTTYRMSYNVFKHYISSSQTERGYRTRANLHQAEEELQAIKADTHSFVASIVDQRINAMIPMMIEKVTSGVISAIKPMLVNAPSNARPQTKSEPIPLVAAMNETTALFTIRSNYEKAFGKQRNQRFNAVIANACRTFGYSVVHRGGVLFVTPEAVRDERVISYAMNAQNQAFGRQEKIEPGFAKRMRNKIRPALGQLDLDFLSRN